LATYYGYAGLGGELNGTQFPSSGIITNAEKCIAMTPLPDNREGFQNGVLITAVINMGISTMTTGTFLCRQSTLGTSAVTGAIVNTGGNTGAGTYTASIGTTAGTYAVGGGPLILQWVDLSGTYPIPAYQLTGSTAAGTGTVNSAFITIQPLGS
jgi:hypothetical protein